LIFIRLATIVSGFQCFLRSQSVPGSGCKGKDTYRRDISQKLPRKLDAKRSKPERQRGREY
jgi:hypothetical protein